MAGAAAQNRVISLARKSRSDSTADAGAGADDETNWFHCSFTPLRAYLKTAFKLWLAPLLRFREFAARDDHFLNLFGAIANM